MTRPRIVYLEDDANDLLLLTETLAAEGVDAEMVGVSTPWDFAQALKTASPALILTDGKLPGFATDAALQLARKECPGVPLYCLTGMVTEHKTAAMRDAGAAGTLSKHDMETVVATIRKVLS